MDQATGKTQETVIPDNFGGEFWMVPDWDLQAYIERLCVFRRAARGFVEYQMYNKELQRALDERAKRCSMY